MQTAPNDIKPPLGVGALHRSAAGSRLRKGLRAGVVTVSLLVATRLLAAAWASAWSRVRAPGPASPDELLALTAAGLAVAAAAWLLCGTVLELAARLPGRFGRAADLCSRRATPALARRAAGVVLGLGVGVGAVGGPTPALAVGSTVAVGVDAARTESRQAPDPGFRATVRTAATGPTTAPSAPVAPGFTPAAPRVRPQADPGLLGARASAATTDEVVVHRGDSLWSIAARHLGPEASAAEIDRSWRQWFSLNRDRIGADPDLILPGQVLRTPGADPSASAVR